MTSGKKGGYRNHHMQTTQTFDPCDLTCRMRLSALSDHLHLTFWLVAYGKFYSDDDWIICADIKFNLNEKLFSDMSIGDLI